MNTNEDELLESGLVNDEAEGENAETGETVINEYSFTCDCEHIDYTEQLETLITQTEYLISIEEESLLSDRQLVANNLYMIAFLFGFGVSYLLYRIIKLFY